MKRFKDANDFSKMTPGDLLKYKKYMSLIIKDILAEVKEWSDSSKSLNKAMHRSFKDLEHECAILQLLREECDPYQFEYLMNLH